MSAETEPSVEDEEVRSDVASLQQALEKIREVVNQQQADLQMHRQVLEECLQLREGVQELLQHREALTQCLELQDGIQAVVQSAKVLGELRDRELELELSLAGVSDNTARHGKAISSLAEHQKRSGQTLDAVVRAVKRMARSRSRSRGAAGASLNDRYSEQAAAGALMGQTAYLPASQDGCADATGRPRSGHSQQGAGLEPAFADGLANGQAREDRDDGLQADDWWELPGGNIVEEDQPRLLDGLLEDDLGDGAWEQLDEVRMPKLHGRYAGDADEWPGCFEDGLNGASNGFAAYGARFPTGEDEPRYWSGSSSCGSDVRLWRAAARSRRPRSTKAGIPDTCFGGPGDLGGLEHGASARMTEEPMDDAAIASGEMASCVQGVLARIEEALTKLDSNGSRETAAGALIAGSGRPGRAPRSWAAENNNAGSEKNRTPNHRPHSARGAATPRGAGTPRGGASRVRPGATPYRPRPIDAVDPRLKQAYDQSDRWA